MTKIEQCFEVPGYTEPDYTGRVLTDEYIAAGKHRKWIGGHWNDHGRRQLNFLIEHGLRPEDKLLDVGCGSLRAGHHLVDYLEPSNYYGIDANQSVIQAGYDHELTEDQRAKLPPAILRASDRFGVDFGVQFDVHSLSRCSHIYRSTTSDSASTASLKSCGKVEGSTRRSMSSRKAFRWTVS